MVDNTDEIDEIQSNLKDKDKGFEIVENDFKMVFDGSKAFDLHFKNKKGDWKLHGYNMQLASCIKTIIYDRVSRKFDVVDFRTFFSEVKKMQSEIKQLLLEITGEGF